MSVADDPDDGELEQTSSKLTEGLKSCHALVNSYRMLLSSELGGEGDELVRSEETTTASDPDET